MEAAFVYAFEGLETVASIESDSVGLGIRDDPDAAQ
jgi:hypothetical protein